MTSAPSRLRNVLGHLLGGSSTEQHPAHHIAQLSPTYFLERAAAIEPDAEAVYHITANGKVLRRSYMELADRARGLAYFLRKHSYKRVGLIAPNTPAFLESIYGIVAGGGVIVPVNIRLKPDDISYILDFAEVDSIIVDAEYEGLLDAYRQTHPNIPIIVDLVRPPPPSPLPQGIPPNPPRTPTQTKAPSAAPTTTPSAKACTTTAAQAPTAGPPCNRAPSLTKTT